MEKRLSLIGMIEQLPDAYLDELFTVVQRMADLEEKKPACPRCQSAAVIRYGTRCNKRRFLCKSCGRTFVETTNTIMFMSHQPKAVWNEVIKDTFGSVSLNKTAERLDISHQCVFDMRHKILLAIQDEQSTVLSEVAELDETFVLDNYKGKKLPDEVSRNPRKHGAVAEKRGISSEYVCICTGIQRKGPAIATTVNRAKPSAEELGIAYNGKLLPGTLTLFDGLRSYPVWGKSQGLVLKDVTGVCENEKGFFNLNTVNRFHSFIKECYRSYRGVATKYLNRYNALLSVAYRITAEKIRDYSAKLLTAISTRRSYTCHDVKMTGLLTV